MVSVNLITALDGHTAAGRGAVDRRTVSFDYSEI